MKQIKRCFSCDELFQREKFRLVNEPTEIVIDWLGVSTRANTYRHVDSGAYFIYHGDKFKENLLKALYENQCGDDVELDYFECTFLPNIVIDLDYKWMRDCSPVIYKFFEYINSQYFDENESGYEYRQIMDTIYNICQEARESAIDTKEGKHNSRDFHKWWLAGYSAAKGIPPKERQKLLIDLHRMNPNRFSVSSFETLCEELEKNVTSPSVERTNYRRRRDLEVLRHFADTGEVAYDEDEDKIMVKQESEGLY